MNKQRRAEIEKAVSLIAEAKSLLETARDEEQDYFYSMPESIQDGQKGELVEMAVSTLDEAIDGLDLIDLTQALA